MRIWRSVFTAALKVSLKTSIGAFSAAKVIHAFRINWSFEYSGEISILRQESLFSAELPSAYTCTSLYTFCVSAPCRTVNWAPQQQHTPFASDVICTSVDPHCGQAMVFISIAISFSLLFFCYLVRYCLAKTKPTATSVSKMCTFLLAKWGDPSLRKTGKKSVFPLLLLNVLFVIINL